jgi:hypothetical protein
LPKDITKSLARRRTSFRPFTDLTLTRDQADQQGFRPEAFRTPRQDFRYRSNLTRRGYKTGYHEAVVTTDTFEFLRTAATALAGPVVLPLRPGSYFAKFGGESVDAAQIRMLLRLADGYRTDTAQTILSSPGGHAAGHAGSDLDTKNQEAAHDLLREKVMELVRLPLTEPGMSESSVSVLFGAIAVTSMAPGEVARQVKGGTTALKAGEVIKNDWEVRRNDAKRRVKSAYDVLNDPERSFVFSHASTFLDSVQMGGATMTRRIGTPGTTDRPTSPMRGRGIVDTGKVAGEGYDSAAGPSVTHTPPANVAEWSLWFTQPFRENRRLGGGATALAAPPRPYAA